MLSSTFLVQVLTSTYQIWIECGYLANPKLSPLFLFAAQGPDSNKHRMLYNHASKAPVN